MDDLEYAEDDLLVQDMEHHHRQNLFGEACVYVFFQWWIQPLRGERTQCFSMSG